FTKLAAISSESGQLVARISQGIQCDGGPRRNVCQTLGTGRTALDRRLASLVRDGAILGLENRERHGAARRRGGDWIEQRAAGPGLAHVYSSPRWRAVIGPATEQESRIGACIQDHGFSGRERGRAGRTPRAAKDAPALDRAAPRLGDCERSAGRP